MISWRSELAQFFLPQNCLLCQGEVSPGVEICRTCQIYPAPYWRQLSLPVLAGAPYSHQLSKLILAAKEENLASARRTLARLMAQALLANTPNLIAAEITFLAAPSRPSAKRRRGYDHAAKLAGALADLVGGVALAPFQMARGVSDQTKLSHQGRAENLAGRISIRPRLLKQVREFSGRVLLVDDVATSGSTLWQSQLALAEAGLSAEFGLVAAGAFH